MSYYILPKKNTIFNLNPTFSFNNSYTISNSLYFYLKKQKEQTIYIEEIFKSINPYEFIFSKVPGYNFSVSKLMPPSENFYILMELSYIFNLFESFSKKDITTMHFSLSPESTIECLDMLREDKRDIHLSMSLEKDLFKFLSCPQINNFHMIEFMYFDVEPFDELSIIINEEESETFQETLQIKFQEYFNQLIGILLNIIIYQNRNGISVIKIGNIFNKFMLDFIFILTGLFEKVYIIKPHSCDIFKSDRFIVCKFFDYKNYNIIETLKSCISENVIKKEGNSKFLTSLIEVPLPYYFLNKIEECNIIIGEQQLEVYDQVNNIIKNKNKDEKLENIRKNNIQKCIQMCEKFKIPYNKFSDKINIFLQGHISDDNFLHNSFISNNMDAEVSEIISGAPIIKITDYEDLLDVVDMFLIMTVEPGFGGQAFMDEMLPKIRRTREIIGDRPIWLQVDGGISLETIERATQAGADTFVAGSAVFKAQDPALMVASLRALAQNMAD